VVTLSCEIRDHRSVEGRGRAEAVDEDECRSKIVGGAVDGRGEGVEDRFRVDVCVGHDCGAQLLPDSRPNKTRT
jgi:hypothetical protein